MTKTVDGSNLGYLIGKIRADFWAKGDTSELTIDAVPTKGSANLVESGGVYDFLNGSYVVVASLPTADATTMNKIYLVGPDGNGNYDRYITEEAGGVYTWLQIGSTAIDLSDYALQADVDAIEEEIDGIDALKKIVNDVVTPSVAYNEAMTGNFTSTSSYNSFILSPANANDVTITGVKVRVFKVAGALYSAKIVTTEATGRLKITALKEVTLTEPSDTFEDETIIFDNPMTLRAGDLLGIIADTDGVIKCGSVQSSTYDNSTFYPRSVTYGNMAAGAYVWPYNVSSTTTAILPVTFIYEAKEFKEFATENYVGLEITASEGRTDAKIAEVVEELTGRILNGYPTVWEVGAWSNGAIQPSSLYISTSSPIPVKAGQIFRCTKDSIIYKVEGDVYTQLANSVKNYTFIEDMFVVISVNIFSLNTGTVTAEMLTAFNASNFVISIDYYDIRKRYSDTQNEVINYESVRHSLPVSSPEQTMAHVASCQYDSTLKTFWAVYYANNTTTIENADDVKTYLTLVNFNPYTNEFKRVELLKANETKVGFTQGNMPPYDPVLAAIDSNTISVIFECYDTQHGIAKMVVNKSDFFTAAESGSVSPLSGLRECPLVSITKATLEYGGNTYNIDCSGMESMYAAYKGEAIGTISNLCMSMKPFLYNGLYYATVQDIFDASGLMPVLMSSSDLVAWDFVKVFDEMTWDTFAETSIVIRDGLVYLSGRTVNTTNMVEVYDLANAQVVCPPYPLIFSEDCKTALCIFDGRVILAANFICARDVNTGFRKNMGFWEMNADGGYDLLCKVLTQDGMHYPDLVIANDELYLLFSTDKRFLNRGAQRSNIGFAKILI